MKKLKDLNSTAFCYKFLLKYLSLGIKYAAGTSFFIRVMFEDPGSQIKLRLSKHCIAELRSELKK